VLATLVQRDPLLLRFDVPEVDAQRLRTGMAVTFRLRSLDAPLSAQIVHVAASADPATRMVPITAHVAGQDVDAARPGAFAEVRVPVGSVEAGVVVPETAIRPSQRGFIAYVVEDGVAHERVVDTGLRTTSGDVEIKSGLKAGETVVVRGAEALRDGAPVKIVAPSAPSAPAASGAAAATTASTAEPHGAASP
jgi:RND family efflux transporter MFP subunit